MKASEIIDAAIEEAKSPIVIELPNGQQWSTTGYRHGQDAKGNPVLVIVAGRAKAK